MKRRGVITAVVLAFVGLMGAFGCSQPETPPLNYKTRPTPKTLPEQALYLWERDIDEYREHTKDPKSLRPQAEEFMRAVHLNMLPTRRGPHLQETVEMGKRLIDQGCEDPLVRIYYGKAVSDEMGIFHALPILADGLNAWPDSGYPKLARRLGVLTMFAEAKYFAEALPWSNLRDEAACLAAARVADDTIDPAMRRVLFHELSQLMGGGGKHWEDAVAVHERCANESNADPWLIHMLAGDAYVARAWHHRGDAWAQFVPDEAWEPFRDNLRKAADEYTAAMKLHPENPEAAAAMIKIATAGESDRSVREWFDLAVEAEFDYMPAYDNLRWALRPRWQGSLDEMYQFGCECAETRRYDTDVPLVLLYSLDNIDREQDLSGEIWRRDGVYSIIKQALEGMASDPSRTDGSDAYLTESRIKTIHALMAMRAAKGPDAQCAEARRLVDELGDRFHRATFDAWAAEPEAEFTKIYAFSGKAGPCLEKAWETLRVAPKPYRDQDLLAARALYEKGLAADDHERSRALCQSWINELNGRLEYSKGNWYEKNFTPYLLAWSLYQGVWVPDGDRSAIGHSRRVSSRVLIRPGITPLLPLELEFDVEMPRLPEQPVNLGLFIPEQGASVPSDVRFQRFFIRTRENRVVIDVCGSEESVPCKLRPVNRIRVRLADGYAAIYVNDDLRLERSDENLHFLPAFNLGSDCNLLPDMRVRISNVRFRYWEPPKDEEDTEPKDDSRRDI
ncbi:MAG: tetratricopeptide repeat protein [Planctomycetota bacterium]